MDNIYKNIKECNPNIKRKILIVFDDTIPDILSIKKLNPIVVELFIRERKLNISPVFITQSYFTIPKNRVNSAQYFVMKILKKESFEKSHLIIHKIFPFYEELNKLRLHILL